MVKLDTFTAEDFERSPLDFFSGIQADEVINAKDMPYEDKIRFIKYCMAYTDLVNVSALANISFLVYGKNISDDAFSDERILFTNLEEYVDAKYDLKAEIEQYGKELLRFYLGALKSYSMILPDGKIPIPSSYKVILTTSEIKDISKLMTKYSFDLADVPLVFEADYIIDSFRAEDSPIIRDFINTVMENLKK